MRANGNTTGRQIGKVLVALLSVGIAASPAHAGTWKFVELQQSERDQIAIGTTKVHRDADSSSGQVDSIMNWKDSSYPLLNTDKTIFTPLYMPSAGFSNVIKVGAWAEVKGDVRVALRWVRRKLADGVTPDPADNPPAYMWLAVDVTASTGAGSDITGAHRDTSKEHIFIAVSRATEEDISTNLQTARRASGQIYVTVEVDGQPENRVFSPWMHIEAKATLDGGRVYSTIFTSPQNLTGMAIVAANYSAQITPLAFLPNPAGLALDDCILRVGATIFNQYLITEGVPCAITYSGTDASFVEQIRQSATWQMSNPPLPLLPSAGTKVTTANGTSTIYPAQFLATTPIVATPGLLFNLSNGLPVNNSAFGTRTLTHSLLGRTITAPISIFYPTAGTQHPFGGPTGWSYSGPINPLVTRSEIATPNWLYYYNQIVPPPCTVFYAPPVPGKNWQGAYYGGEPNVWLLDAHDSWQTAIFRKSSGLLSYVGKEEVGGVDAYARILKHEFVHKKCYEYIHRLGANPAVEDSDRDRVPDVWEDRVGLKHDTSVGLALAQDSTSFSQFWGNAYPEEQGDSEVFARLYEEGVFGPMGDDWADDGLQKVGPPPNVCKRTVVRSMNAGFPITYTIVNSLSQLPGTQVTDLPLL